MNDTKNILIAWASSASTIASALDTRDLITIISAIVLPVLFFTVGKSVDVALQVYLAKRKDRQR